jgi:hypothetical protein
MFRANLTYRANNAHDTKNECEDPAIPATKTVADARGYSCKDGGYVERKLNNRDYLAVVHHGVGCAGDFAMGERR